MNEQGSAGPEAGAPSRQERPKRPAGWQGSPAPQKNRENHIELTELILGCCYEVANELGIGFLETVYKNALVIALCERQVKIDADKAFDVIFRKKRVGLYIADLVVNNAVIIEVKSCSALLPTHQAQLINYLAASSCQVGLLVNFGTKRLEVKRLYHPRLREEEVVPF
jgi:GxxExxY protein